MPPRVPRIRLWMLMALVALVAVGLAAVLMVRRSREFASRARNLADSEAEITRFAEMLDQSAVFRAEMAREGWEGLRRRFRDMIQEGLLALPVAIAAAIDESAELAELWREASAASEDAASVRRLAATVASLRREYERAASRPWLTPPAGPADLTIRLRSSPLPTALPLNAAYPPPTFRRPPASATPSDPGVFPTP